MTDLDKMARAQGYPDYATMAAFMQRQQAGYHQNAGAVMTQPGVYANAPAQNGEPQGLTITQRFQNWLNRAWPQ